MKKLLVIALSAMMLFAFTACQPGGIPEDKKITTVEMLQSAATQGGEWWLGKNLEINEQLVVSGANFVLNGEGKTISRDTANLDKADYATNAVILVTADSAVLRNLTVDGLDSSNEKTWTEGVWGIKVFDAEGVVLSDITVNNVQAGIQINSAKARVEGTMEFYRTPYGGIGLDQSITPDSASSELSSNATFEIDYVDAPAVYLESSTKGALTINGGNLVNKTYHPKEGDDARKAQVWYFTDKVTPDSNVVVESTPQV